MARGSVIVIGGGVVGVCSAHYPGRAGSHPLPSGGRVGVSGRATERQR